MDLILEGARQRTASRAAAKEKEVNSPDIHDSHPKPSKRFCKVCAKPSEQTICDSCAMKIHLDALARKTHEEKGNAWGKWESPESAHKHRH
jgi:hypothetical protein